MKSGRVLGTIKAETGLVHMNHGGILPAQWSADSSYLIWTVDGKWSFRALVLLNASSLDPQLVSDTLATLLKYEADIAKAREHVGYIAGAELPATVR